MKRLVLMLCLLAAPAFAVEPDEILDDPVLEARARELSQGLRCPVCQNESIDESHAPVAQELRVVLRERLVAGDTDAQVVDYMVFRYGEYVLLRPNAQGANLILWLAAPLMLLLALGVGWVTIRRKSEVAAPLSADEEAALEEILKQ
ncbi:cytochrome C biogenesis protein CcdA [Loktanella sp. D2R18]|uniref:cytochrome c-type biogenesis protein n=1 Tax=Rhodobacterales TaxID=204455 RepID=UPI000DE9B451|nr:MULTISPECIES: cytochrome c-type biogenesis protein [Rhodobacterales]MDO6590633.1 cytochrome c-type biogenesis protein CcmH [Yoonia sp. 1_MG-2023]RBW44741.1 cytochrome C biogenesis protein CcdA [Loktanella sp. D2R18]